MSTKSGGSFATILLALPLTAIALMGVFGVPEFASVIASPDRAELLRRPFGGSTRDYDSYYESDRNYPRESGYEQRRDPFAEDAPAFGGSSSVRRSDERGRYYDNERPAERYADASSDSRYGQRSSAAANTASQLNRHDEAQRGNPFLTTMTSESRPEEGNEPRTAIWDERNATAPSSAQLDWRSAARKLADMGIDRYHLERGSTPESFLFVCLVTPSDNSNVTHRFESEHSDPLAAVNQVLHQVDGWLQQRYAQSNFPSRHASAR